METDGGTPAAASCSRDQGVVRPSSVTLTDPEVLDCPICYEPLTIPVFQCENGHMSCSSCTTMLSGKCPSCRGHIGQNRNRGIEKVLESAKVACRNSNYGCKEMICYAKQHDHEERCHYSPCLCPLSNCNFVGSSRKLNKHFSDKHMDSVIHFEYGVPFEFNLDSSQRFVVFQEANSDVSFILSNYTGILGNEISICCFAPASKGVDSEYVILAGETPYGVQSRGISGGSTIKFQSRSRSVQNRDDIPPLRGSFLLLQSVFVSDDKFELGIIIRPPGYYLPMGFCNSCDCNYEYLLM